MKLYEEFKYDADFKLGDGLSDSINNQVRVKALHQFMRSFNYLDFYAKLSDLQGSIAGSVPNEDA